MADAEMTEGRIPGDQSRCDAEIEVQVLNGIRWQMATAVDRTAADKLVLFFCSSYERSFGTFVYSYQSV
jgi:hypothetical protein